MTRGRAGNRRYRLTAQTHDTTQDAHGNPTYPTTGDWDTEATVTNWPVEMLTVGAGEKIRGRQVTSETTHVFLGEYYGGKDIDSKMRVYVGSDTSVTYDVVAAFDPDNQRREFRVEAKIQE